MDTQTLLNQLKSLALDLIWSWTHKGDKIWETLDPVLWDLTRNPWDILQTVSAEKLALAWKDKEFQETVEQLFQRNEEISQTPGWFDHTHKKSPLSCIAYFSMEYMLSEALPIYSGGLGNVAGDQLKAASDLGVPVIGIGLLYQQGYFRQMIDKDGNQQAFYPFNDPGQLPIKPMRKPNGEWLRIEFSFPGYSIWIRVWEVQIGKVRLYLLDSNDPANFPPYRTVTNQLYGDGRELRLMQELVLGIGGWRLIEALNLKPEVCHLNEGHAAFLVLDRARSYMEDAKVSFATALEATRVGNLFTTHTAVPAAFDRFSPELMRKYLEPYAKNKLGIDFQDLIALGRENPEDTAELFNMGYLAMRGSGAVNGVSELHGKVSQSIFQPLFPRWPQSEVPIGSVTNGIHVPSWNSLPSYELWTKACGKERWMGSIDHLEQMIRKVPDVDFWKMRFEGRKILIEYARTRFRRQLVTRNAPPEQIEAVDYLFDPQYLTLGFARRFATYKRPNLLLQDKERLLRLLNNKEKPVQLIIAGKAYPTDEGGKAMIKEWMDFIYQHRNEARIIFLSDYDMLLTQKMVQGVDVWINTPRRPWEACGTSGMKVLANGGLNVSELDGWWAEAYTPSVGWAIGDGAEHGNDPTLDQAEGEHLYEILEQVSTLFYDRNSDGIPVEWVKRIRESMASLTPHFSANRSVREYVKKYYLPAAANFKERTAEKGKKAIEIVLWREKIKKCWNQVWVGQLRHSETHFQLTVNLGGLSPSEVSVELFANGIEGRSNEVIRMKYLNSGENENREYEVYFETKRPLSDYTARIIPHFEGVKVPLEMNQIVWG